MYITFLRNATGTADTTVRAPKPGHQFNIFEIFDLFDFIKQTASPETEAAAQAPKPDPAATPTPKKRYSLKEILTEGANRVTIERSRGGLANFYENHKNPIWWENIPEPPKTIPVEDIPKHYRTFKIPKRSGGFRQIDAPDDELKAYQDQLKSYFEDTLGILTHDAAHAYVKARGTITAVKRHQSNNSKWFLKLDMKNFFPSHNLAYVMRMLRQVYPLGFLMENAEYCKKLENALKYAFLNDSLPQGTPLSPTLTNICMIPIDFQIKKYLGRKPQFFIYTRYADDMTFSSRLSFKFIDIVKLVKDILVQNEAPFFINSKKTIYQSSSGSNWILGVMLNRENKMTIGYRKVKMFKVTLFNLIHHPENFTAEDKQELSGLISYYKMIDKEMVEGEIAFYEKKFNVKIKDLLDVTAVPAK